MRGTCLYNISDAAIFRRAQKPPPPLSRGLSQVAGQLIHIDVNPYISTSTSPTTLTTHTQLPPGSRLISWIDPTPLQLTEEC